MAHKNTEAGLDINFLNPSSVGASVRLKLVAQRRSLLIQCIKYQQKYQILGCPSGKLACTSTDLVVLVVLGKRTVPSVSSNAGFLRLRGRDRGGHSRRIFYLGRSSDGADDGRWFGSPFRSHLVVDAPLAVGVAEVVLEDDVLKAVAF
jgi:hypothetical protein